jgi:hypothetical protein
MAEHLVDVVFHEDEPVHISRNTKSFILDFFSFKRMMYVTEKEAKAGGDLGKTSFEEGLFLQAELFCKPRLEK